MDAPEPTPLSDAAIALFPEYAAKIRARLEVGRREYGDESLRRPMLDTLGETEQEIIDIAGWSFFTWLKCRRLMVQLMELEERAAKGNGHAHEA